MTGTEWVEIRAKRLFSCFASKKSEEKAILRKQAGPTDWYSLWRSKNYVCSQCGLTFDHFDQLQNHHEGMKFKDIFEKIISLVHEIGHVIFSDENKFKDHRRILLFEEALAWHLGYDYAFNIGIEINLEEYTSSVEKALQLYAKEIK